ncbi:MAG: hypothetical protein ABI890_14740, partial [Lapillicoccus sp.]
AVDLVVSDDVVTVAGAAASGAAVLVSLPMLARGNPATPPGAFDEARELATYGDVLDAWEAPDPDASGLWVTGGGDPTAYRGLVVPQAAWGASPRVLLDGPVRTLLTDTLAAWAADGSVVVVRSGSADQSARMTAEGVTVDGRRVERVIQETDGSLTIP